MILAILANELVADNEQLLKSSVFIASYPMWAEIILTNHLHEVHYVIIDIM